MIEATQPHTSDETPFDGERVVIAAPAGYVGENETDIAPSALEATLAWQVGQGYGSQLGEYSVQSTTIEPMTEVAITEGIPEGDFAHRELSYVVDPVTVETIPALPGLESNEGLTENIFVIDPDKLASMNEAERKAYLRKKVAAIYDAKEQMSRQWEEYKLQHDKDSELFENIEQGKQIQAVIDNEREDMLAKAKPEESWGAQAKKTSLLSKIWDSMYKVGVEFAPQIVVSAALVAGAAGTATEAQANPWKDLAAAGVNIGAGRASTEVGIQNEGGKQYGRVGAAHQDRREILAERAENQQEKTNESFEAKKIRFHKQYVRDKEALYARNATQAELDLFEKVTSENFNQLAKQRQDAIDANMRKLELAEKHDANAERREVRGVNRTVGEQRGDADANMTQQGIGVLNQVLQGQIQRR